jgi:hypothetical protein
VSHANPEAFYSNSLSSISKKKKNNIVTDIVAIILSGGLLSCSELELFDYSNSILIDNNLISAGSDGSDLIGFCGNVSSYSDTVRTYGINTSGMNTDPVLTTIGDYKFIPDVNSPCIDAGIDISQLYYDSPHLFEDALNYPGEEVRPQGTAWDIGSYEVY